MIPAEFDYAAPATLDEAIGLLQEHGDEAKILTGGHSLVPLMKLRLARPGMVVDLRKIDQLSAIGMDNGSLRIGAAATHDAIQHSDLVSGHCAMLCECAGEIGDLQVRNAGTIGGSVVHADPAADWPAGLLAAAASMVLVGPGGERTVAASDFFVGLMESAIGEGEILTAVSIPAPSAQGCADLKMAQQASGFALCGVAALVQVEGGNVTSAKVGITGVANTPYRAAAVEAAVSGGLEAAAGHAADGVTPLDDIHASSAYRSHLAAVFTRRALETAAARAGGSA